MKVKLRPVFCGPWMVIAALAALACANPTTEQPALVSTIGGMPGPEDLVVDTSSGRTRLLVSSLDRTDKTRSGDIFEVDLDARPPRVSKLEIEWSGRDSRFRPHGIALLTDPPRPPRLFVINHRSDFDPTEKESIDVFTVDGQTLHFFERITGPHLRRPNDLAVRSTRGGGYQLAVSNPAQGGELLWERFVGPGRSYVTLLRSDEDFSTRMRGFRYANGVAFGPGGVLYVASSIDEAVFGHVPDSPARTEIGLDMLVDNITVEERGTMIVTGGGSMTKFLRHSSAAQKRKTDVPLSPTRVWRVDPGPPPRTTLLFEDGGWRISGGSSAVCVKGDLYIGQVFGDFLLKAAGACPEQRR